MFKILFQTKADYAPTIARIVLGFAGLVMCAQLFWGMFLIAGLVGRLAALGIIGNMVVAVAKVHWQYGFIMNWFGTQKGEGDEYHLLAIALGLILVLRGSGSFSLDRLLERKLESIPEEMRSEEKTEACPAHARF
jgi:uncharacterized membrane protein YphA (DoxX/SURF4 family)